MIHYAFPDFWIKYNLISITSELIGAKSFLLSLTEIPYQRSWLDEMQKMELKREVAGTSRIEGADFTEQELEEALKDTPSEFLTRSQKQVQASVRTYKWIANLPHDTPIDDKLIKEIHRRIIEGADDDHCEGGVLRKADQNVTFGQPPHRGVNGGDECERAFLQFTEALRTEYSKHDLLIQAISAHYHLAAMHPFLDGNGRTARALEALILQRAGLRDVCFIAMSNYYYEEKINYLTSLAAVREIQHDLTPFLRFALKGISIQAKKVLKQIHLHQRKALFIEVMYGLVSRLKSKRKRVIGERQINILKILLEADELELLQLFDKAFREYSKLKKGQIAFLRDLSGLIQMNAIKYWKNDNQKTILGPRLEWPTEITETEFFERIQSLPKSKTLSFL